MHIVIGTIVCLGRAGSAVQDIRTVEDMCDDQSPLGAEATSEVEAVLFAALGHAGKGQTADPVAANLGRSIIAPALCTDRKLRVRSNSGAVRGGEVFVLKLYHALLSPCAQKVRLVLHEKGLPYEAVLFDLATKEHLTPAYLAINPNGVVPTLIDDGAIIIESSNICAYLDDKFPETAMQPTDPLARSKMRLWAKRVDDRIHPACGVLLFGAILRLSFLHQTAAERAAMLARMPDPARRERQADLLENGLDSLRVPDAAKILRDMADDIDSAVTVTPWLLGNALTISDFLVLPYVRVIESLGLSKVFDDRPALTAWYQRAKATRGFTEGMAAFEPQAMIDEREKLLPSIIPKLERFF